MDEQEYNAQLEELMAGLESPEDQEDKFNLSDDTPAPAPVADPDEADEPDTPEPPKQLSAEDQAAAIEAMGRKLDVLGGYVYNQSQQQQRQPQAQPQHQQQYQPQPQAQPVQAQEPYIWTNQDMVPFVQQLQHVQQSLYQNAWNQEAMNFKQAEANLRQRFPDFDQVIPEYKRTEAFDQLAKSGQFGQNWQARFEHVYKAFAYDKVAARADEVQQKREAKRTATTRAAAAVPPSGAVFQQPEVKLDRSRRGYADAVNASREALRAL